MTTIGIRQNFGSGPKNGSKKSKVKCKLNQCLVMGNLYVKFDVHFSKAKLSANSDGQVGERPDRQTGHAMTIDKTTGTTNK